MSRKYKFHNPDGVYFVTFAVQGWVNVFTRNEYKNIPRWRGFVIRAGTSRKYKFHNPDGVYFVTFAVQGWVDAPLARICNPCQYNYQ